MEERVQKKIDLAPTRRQPRFARLVELKLSGDALDSGHAGETDSAA